MTTTVRIPDDTLVDALAQIEKRLSELGVEYQMALRLFRDAKVRMVEASAAVAAAKAEYDILRNRAMILQSELKALPRP